MTRFSPAISLTQALCDADLFGPTFAAESFWTWKTVAKMIDGIALTEKLEIKLFEEATGLKYRNRKSRRACRRLILLAGRRAGKDRFLSAGAVWRSALCANWNEWQSAGEGAVVILIGRDKRQAGVLRRYCEGLLRAPLLAAEVVRRTDEAIEFRNGASVEIITNNASLVRNRSAIGIFGTECCHWRTDQDNASSDTEVVGAAEPSMAMCPDGGLLILGSSVFCKVGYMYNQYRRLHGNEHGSSLAWFAPSAVMNPKLPAAVVEAAIAEDGPRGRAEFLNVWRENASDLLPLDIIESCTDFGVVERPPQRGLRYVAYGDAASGTGKDSFALAIGHALNDEARSIELDLVRERKPRFVAADCIREYAEILRSYGVHEIICDDYAAGFSADEWRRNGITFKSCANSTSENYLCALPLLTSKRAHLLDHPVLRSELAGLERQISGGHETVSHQARSSAHDDVAAAVCGCLVELAAHPSIDWALHAPRVIQESNAMRYGVRSFAGVPAHNPYQLGDRQLARLRRGW